MLNRKKRMQSKKRLLERNGNLKSDWLDLKIILRFDMSKPEITEDIKNDLQMLNIYQG